MKENKGIACRRSPGTRQSYLYAARHSVELNEKKLNEGLREASQTIKIINTASSLKENLNAFLGSFAENTGSQKENVKLVPAAWKSKKTFEKFLNPGTRNNKHLRKRTTNFSSTSGSVRSGSLEEIEVNLTNCKTFSVEDIKRQFESLYSRRAIREEKVKAEVERRALLEKVKRLQRDLDKSQKENQALTVLWENDKVLWKNRENALLETQSSLLEQIRHLSEGISQLKSQWNNNM